MKRRWRCSTPVPAKRIGPICGPTSIGAFEPVKAVVYDFADSRAGKHAREFLGAAGEVRSSATITLATRR
jgi:hypothetical protein